MMQPLILDRNFDAVLVLDYYESFIWTERYSKAGDFEIQVPVKKELLDQIKTGYYVYLQESDKLMIIETLKIKTNPVDGNRLTITGRSLEILLARRIVWQKTTLDGYLDGQIQKLLNENLISPEDTNRQILGFIYQTSTDPIITSMTIRSQYTGDNIYDILVKICQERNIGFKVTFDKLHDTFIFGLYAGKDRSYDQTDNEPIEFSPDFDNLLNSDYIYNSLNYASMAVIAGEGEGDERRRALIFVDEGTGLDRREVYIDARDLKQDEGETDEEYLNELAQRGVEKLVDYRAYSSFDGSMDTDISQIFNSEYFLGDIVYVKNEYGFAAKCRVTELIRSNSASGYKEYPTFEMI